MLSQAKCHQGPKLGFCPTQSSGCINSCLLAKFHYNLPKPEKIKKVKSSFSIAAEKGGHYGTKELCFCYLAITLIYLNQLCFRTFLKSVFLLSKCLKSFGLQQTFYGLRNKYGRGNAKITLTISCQTSGEKSLQ